MGRWILFILILACQPAWAIEFKFGPEFTVSNEELLYCQKKEVGVLTMRAYRSLYCGNQAIATKHRELEETWRSKYIAWAPKDEAFEYFLEETPLENKSAYLSPDGYHVWLGVDPGVLELGHSPMTVREINANKKQLQQMIFDDTKELGLKPQWLTGGGHINIGLSEFQNNPLLLINFLRDLYNHPELSMGVFGYDTNNALTLRQIDSNPFLFDNLTKKIFNTKSKGKWKYLIEVLNQVLNPQDFDQFLGYWNQGRDEQKQKRGSGYAVTLHRIEGEDRSRDRIEIRAVRPQMSIDQWIRMTRLLQARLNYLAQFDELIPIEEDKIDIRRTGATETLVENPPVDPQKALARFYQYVTESGENWLDHQDYLWFQWHIDGEIIKFNDHMIKTCEDFLAP